MIKDLRKNTGKISLIGFIVFFISWLILTISLYQNPHMRNLSMIFAKMDIPGLKAFYLKHPTPAVLIITDYVCILAYMAFSVAFIIYFADRNAESKVLNGIGKVMILVAFIAGLTDLVETTITTIGAAVDYNIPDILMKIHVRFTYAKGLIWLAILWTGALAVITLVRKNKNDS